MKLVHVLLITKWCKPIISETFPSRLVSVEGQRLGYTGDFKGQKGMKEFKEMGFCKSQSPGLQERMENTVWLWFVPAGNQLV